MKTAQEILAKNLKRMRAKLGFTQAHVAEAIDIALRSYQKYEQQETFPDDKNLDKLARLYKVGVGDLLTPDAPDASPKRSPSLGIAEVARLLTALSMASAPRRALILALLYRDESYLDALPRELAPAARALAKVP